METFLVKPRFVSNPTLEGLIVEKVFINETQYFDNVPQTAWEFYIGVINQHKNG